MSRDPFDGAPDPDRPGRRALVRDGAAWQLQPPGTEAYSVTAVNALARRLLESSLPPLWVRGEVTGWKRHPSGHCYFSLRDRSSQLRAVMFRLEAEQLPTHPEEGMQVRALGTLTLYERRGEYQFVVRELEGVAAGGLWRVAFDRLRTKLEAEGLLAAERKRPLPRHPGTVAVVTSPVGAALQDILHVIEARAPWTRVLFVPARVQGDGAARDLARAVRAASHSGLADVMIVGRGGGSTEDLWAFNEEVLAREIAASRIPVISAVGHEVDVTIADLVADVRAATPSAAAERAVPDGAMVRRELAASGVRLAVSLRRAASTRRSQLEALDRDLRDVGSHIGSRRRERLERLAHRLDALSPLAALRRGFAVPLDSTGRILRTTSEFVPGARVRLRVSDGTVACRAERIERTDENGGE
ncbi:MAG: exodeoxyribonuclease VII large subunit [Longimicrobiales bacterium]